MRKKHLSQTVCTLVVLTVMAVCLVACGSQSAMEKSSSELKWPSSGLAKMLPTPESNVGEITLDSSDIFMADIDDYDESKYSTYVEGCKELGFTVDYSSTSTYYMADNSDGYSLSLTFDSDQMSITLSAPSESSSSSSESSVPSSSESSVSSSENPETSTASPDSTPASDFKATMDSYEAFFDKYIAFMQKYNDEGHPVSMLAEYSSLMTQYAETTAKLDALEEEDLSPEDQAYFIEVQTRINQKLTDAALSM